jgi:hypothetical protein
LGSFGQFLALKKYQLALKNLAFPIAFQADDEGSIPFTRSSLFNYLAHFTPGVDTCRTVEARNHKLSGIGRSKTVRLAVVRECAAAGKMSAGSLSGENSPLV